MVDFDCHINENFIILVPIKLPS